MGAISKKCPSTELFGQHQTIVVLRLLGRANDRDRKPRCPGGSENIDSGSFHRRPGPDRSVYRPSGGHFSLFPRRYTFCTGRTGRTATQMPGNSRLGIFLAPAPAQFPGPFSSGRHAAGSPRCIHRASCAVVSGVGECGGHVKHCPYSGQPNWQRSRTQVAVNTCRGGETMTASRHPARGLRRNKHPAKLRHSYALTNLSSQGQPAGESRKANRQIETPGQPCRALLSRRSKWEGRRREYRPRRRDLDGLATSQEAVAEPQVTAWQLSSWRPS